MASAKRSRKKSWIDWADRTFGSVIHTSFIHLGGGTNARQVRDPLDTSPRPVTLRALWHSPLSSASPTARRKTHEDSASAGSRHREASAGGGEDEGRHHHSRHGEGEADRGSGDRRWQRKGAGGRQGAPAGREGGRPHPVLEVRRHGEQGRGCRAPDVAR